MDGPSGSRDSPNRGAYRNMFPGRRRVDGPSSSSLAGRPRRFESPEREHDANPFQLLPNERVGMLFNLPRRGNGDSALHVAASGGHVKIVSALLDAGIEADVFGHRQRTPLHCAAEQGHMEVTLCLLETGAQVLHADSDGNTALSLAAGNGHVDIVTLLLKKEAELEKLASR